MSASPFPTPDEIDAVIFDMIAAEAAQMPDDTGLDDLWSSEAYDPQGEFQGYGYGHTPTEARAGAWITVWITVWWPDCDLRDVPRVVPEGWSFEIHPPGEAMIFRRTTAGEISNEVWTCALARTVSGHFLGHRTSGD
jgi:hypothetical protein